MPPRDGPAAHRPAQRLSGLVRDVPDFPRPGVRFKDITPALADPVGLRTAVAELVRLAPAGVDTVVGMEARGFIVGAPVAVELGAGFVPVRKPGKLPGPTVERDFALEYGTDRLAMHADALRAGARVLVVDDVLATGGTAAAAAGLVRAVGAEVIGVTVLLELAGLGGRAMLAGLGVTRIASVLTVGD